MSTPNVSLRINNFCGITEFEWSPKDVCLLIGANGSGKTRVLETFSLLSFLFNNRLKQVLCNINPLYTAHFAANKNAPFEIELQVGDTRWMVDYQVSTKNSQGLLGEKLYHKDQLILSTEVLEERWDIQDCCVKLFWDRKRPEWMKPFVTAINNIRNYGPIDFNSVKIPLSSTTPVCDSQKDALHLWPTLQNWMMAPMQSNNKFSWIVWKMKKTFPRLISTMDLNRGVCYKHMSSGLFLVLMYLTLIVNVPNGSIIIIENFESNLDPYAIRSLLAAIRERSEENNLTVILTSHSPIVINEFKRNLEQVYVMERGHKQFPIPLTDLHDPEWLAHFSPGDLYDRGEFGSSSVIESMSIKKTEIGSIG